MYSINRLMSTSLATFCTVTFSNPRILFWRTYCFVDHCLYICLFPFGYCVFCLSSIYGFWLPLWYLLITSLVSSDYLFGIFWLSLWYLLITSLVSSDYFFGIFWLSLWYLLIISLVSSDYFFGIFWLLLWYLLITSLVSSNFCFP